MKLRTLISQEELVQRIGTLAEEISRDYFGEEIILIGILKGSLYFLADLSRAIRVDMTIDLMQFSSYHGGTVSTGIVQIRKDLDSNIEGKHVLIVEDIVDTGHTLAHVRELLATRKPQSLKVVTLLSKRVAKSVETKVEYVGFEISDEFVVGYGLDYGERFRNLPDIQVLEEL